ncbi:hypothetical protein R9X47_11300 [Wukongibacter baidiensis]|uniref:hypothetical protein n=1 Tax=Wukongibacter baidiensis TaxID=1723361 RepID=UPI003D7F8166
MGDQVVSIKAKEDQLDLGDGLILKTLTGFINIRKELEVDGRKISISSVLPFVSTNVTKDSSKQSDD